MGHEATRTGVQEWDKPWDAPVWTPVEWGDVELEPSFLTYQDGVTLWVDDLRCAGHRTCGQGSRPHAVGAAREPGARIDVLAAIQDMIAFNGGKPLSCHA